VLQVKEVKMHNDISSIEVQRHELEAFIDARISLIARMRIEATNAFLAEQNQFVIGELKMLRSEMRTIVRGETAVHNHQEKTFRNGYNSV
jgi:hypothetical protein